MPKRVKFRKQCRGRMSGVATRGSELAFGDYGLKALECAWLTAIQIEASRVALTRHVKRGGKIWLRVFPDKSYSKKPAETRMGKGKGNVDHWVAVIRPGRILFEIGGTDINTATRALRKARYKLGFKTKIVYRDVLGEGS